MFIWNLKFEHSPVCFTTFSVSNYINDNLGQNFVKSEIMSTVMIFLVVTMFFPLVSLSSSYMVLPVDGDIKHIINYTSLWIE